MSATRIAYCPQCGRESGDVHRATCPVRELLARTYLRKGAGAFGANFIVSDRVAPVDRYPLTYRDTVADPYGESLTYSGQVPDMGPIPPAAALADYAWLHDMVGRLGHGGH